MTKQQQRISALVEAHARQAVADDLDLWPRIRARIIAHTGHEPGHTLGEHPRPTAAPTFPSFRRAGLALAALLLIVAFAWTLRPQAVSAAVIMARAGQAIDDASAFGLESFSGHVQGHAVDVGTGEGGVQPYRYTFDKEIAFQAPGKVRVDECVTAAAMSEQCHAVISDGATGWLYLPGSQQAWRFSAGGGTGITFIAADQRSLLENQRDDASLRLLGTETVGGRPAYVLEFAPEPAQREVVASEKIWIDQEFYVELRHETRDEQGNLRTAWSYTRFEANPDLGPSQFDFNPPDGVRVEEGYPLNTNTLYITPELRFVVQPPTEADPTEEDRQE